MFSKFDHFSILCKGAANYVVKAMTSLTPASYHTIHKTKPPTQFVKAFVYCYSQPYLVCTTIVHFKTNIKKQFRLIVFDFDCDETNDIVFNQLYCSSSIVKLFLPKYFTSFQSW